MGHIWDALWTDMRNDIAQALGLDCNLPGHAALAETWMVEHGWKEKLNKVFEKCERVWAAQQRTTADAT